MQSFSKTYLSLNQFYDTLNKKRLHAILSAKRKSKLALLLSFIAMMVGFLIVLFLLTVLTALLIHFLINNIPQVRQIYERLGARTSGSILLIGTYYVTSTPINYLINKQKSYMKTIDQRFRQKEHIHLSPYEHFAYTRWFYRQLKATVELFTNLAKVSDNHSIIIELNKRDPFKQLSPLLVSEFQSLHTRFKREKLGNLIQHELEGYHQESSYLVIDVLTTTKKQESIYAKESTLKIDIYHYLQIKQLLTL
ncbi:hypothetical protein PVA45_02085 [Entomospira entomophila]|uniref:Uncharacterized protein n=1 Tax=Entomospira entomophila TaxID=2719988 RepID=A0A968G819_9SPIO|nr:hypothetical protein [Entomospira entomophilus]NIZ40302.1 hypothetical protein [Entomospira entomophilus]WDI35861.1 hypothetical protein PVA45_02085 [Entomospira entomophilus]